MVSKDEFKRIGLALGIGLVVILAISQLSYNSAKK